MPTPNQNNPVFELRVALTVSDYERSIKFYCDGLGLEPSALWSNGGGQALILDMGKATLEIFDEIQAATIDQIEAGPLCAPSAGFENSYGEITRSWGDFGSSTHHYSLG